MDIDNTVFDWVTYYVASLSALLHKVEGVVGIPYAQLASEAKEIFSRHASIEYPFLIQEMPSVMAYFKHDVDKLLRDGVEPGRKEFLRVAQTYLRPYEGVVETLQTLAKDYPHIPRVALTDAPRYVAMWKLNKLGILPYFDAVYGLADPRIPTCIVNNRVKVDPEILLKHLQQSNFGFQKRIRILPDEYEKPGTRGLKTVLMDHEMDEDPEKRSRVLWVGDNLRKDVGLGLRLGVRTAWAKYGIVTDMELYKKLHEFSPEQNIQKHASLGPGHEEAPKPMFELTKFSELLNCFGK